MAYNAKTSSNAVIVAIWAAALLVVFIAFRFDDLLRLPSLVGNLGGGPLFGQSVLNSAAGAVTAATLLISWLCLGSFISLLLGSESGSHHNRYISFVCDAASGAVAMSLIVLCLGLLGALSSNIFAFITLAVFVLGVFSFIRRRMVTPENRTSERVPLSHISILTAIPLSLAFVSSLAPPVAKDTLLYHFSLPKHFISQGGLGFVEGNIASYLSLGTEMHYVGAMLLGSMLSPAVGEAAAGAVSFLFFPLLTIAVYGWAAEIGPSRVWASIAALMVAAVPTAYHVASSGYVDLSLALYVTLAAYAFTRWWHEPTWGRALPVSIFLGGALSVKLTTLFVIAAFALVVLLRARGGKDGQAGSLRSDAGRIVATGFVALLLAGVIASPWYLRTWKETGSPVFPFYMSIWPGKAAGWDVERSNLFQAMNSAYGGVDTQPINYLTAPLRVSLAAQPEIHELYDGVLGPMFLIGMPFLLFAVWRGDAGPEIKIMTGVAGVVFLFWLFSSQQLRYLLPIIPLIAIAIAWAGQRLAEQDVSLGKALQYSLAAAAFACVLTSFAWFCMKAPFRVVLGGETRDEYLTRNLDYYPYYKWLNTETPADSKVWLINMRRDTYHINRPIISDYIFEDWTLRQMVWNARSAEELRRQAREMGASHVLARHDFLFDHDRSTLVDDKKPRPENEAKLKIAREFLLDASRTVRADEKFSLVRIDK